jgi:hypothetical protein
LRRSETERILLPYHPTLPWSDVARCSLAPSLPPSVRAAAAAAKEGGRERERERWPNVCVWTATAGGHQAKRPPALLGANLLMRSAPLRWGERRPHPTCSRVLHSLDGNNVAIAGALPTARRPPARPASSWELTTTTTPGLPACLPACLPASTGYYSITTVPEGETDAGREGGPTSTPNTCCFLTAAACSYLFSRPRPRPRSTAADSVAQGTTPRVVTTNHRDSWSRPRFPWGVNTKKKNNASFFSTFVIIRPCALRPCKRNFTTQLRMLKAWSTRKPRRLPKIPWQQFFEIRK